MKKIFLFPVFLFIALQSYSQNTVITTGNWNNPTTWSGGDIADDITEDVDYAGGVGYTATVRSGFSYTVGNVTLNSNDGLTLRSGSELILGSSVESKDLNANNNAIILIDGALRVHGDFNVNNNLTLVINGSFIVEGSVNINNNGNVGIETSGTFEVGGDFVGNNNTSLDVDEGGEVNIGGDFIGGNNTFANVDGIVNIGNDIDVGNNSTLVGDGTVSIGGECRGPATFCTGVLPIELLFFTAQVSNDVVNFQWATASEENFDFFTLERSVDAENYEVVDHIGGNGWSKNIVNYKFADKNPLQGRSYYRLKSTDFDGSSEYHSPVMVSVGGIDKDMTLLSNPVSTNLIRFQLNFRPEEHVEVAIRNTSGRVIYKATLKPGLSRYTINEVLRSGMYILEVKAANKRFLSRLVRQ